MEPPLLQRLAAMLVAALPLLLSHVTALAQTQPGEHGSPNAGTAGYYWYWVVGIIVLILLFWGLPRLLRMLKGSPPGRKP